ncbi:HET-domain-containing protein [Aspergillus ambiguus]|uniref:HET domain-containing protein n=1 Tax=Aspergillus ambiguus TaxID=176160 RepID=UPI003CCDA33D
MGSDVHNIFKSTFTYSRLPPEPCTTRMIRLLPDTNKSAPIRCELFNYNLSPLGEEHLYEALSYVWGSSFRSCPILLDGHRFFITESLHAALLHLRGSQLERILWIDAISINQDDDSEKSKQIPLMRMIYAQAKRVIVWLGEAQEYGDKALEVLGSLGRKQNPKAINEKERWECEKLLQRDWFRRIWVLQEVGVAQYISIMCGSVQINGHIFCEGLDNLMPSSALMARINPVSLLIRGALFRSHDEHHSTATLSIGELVSMYCNHNATKHHDKVYALLGLSADADSAALVPNYQLAWHEVFKRLTQHVFPRYSVETWYGSEIAIIKAKGWVLGYIHSCSESLKDSRQTFEVVSNQTCQQLGYHDGWETGWSIQASGELLQDGDIICLLEGLSEPSILRLCADYYTVLTPVVKHKQQVQNREDNAKVSESDSTQGLCDILLAWKVSLSEDRRDSQTLSRLIDVAPNYHDKHCEAEQRQNHITSVMVDAAIQISELGVPGKRALHNILSRGCKLRDRVLEARPWQERGFYENYGAAIEQALWQPDGLLCGWEEMLAVAVQDYYYTCGYIVLSILIQRLGQRLSVSDEVVKAVAANYRSYGPEIMQQLFEQRGDSLPVSEEVVTAAAANTGSGHPIMQLLFEQRGDSLSVSEEVLLFEQRGDRLPVSVEVVKAAAANARRSFDDNRYRRITMGRLEKRHRRMLALDDSAADSQEASASSS